MGKIIKEKLWAPELRIKKKEKKGGLPPIKKNLKEIKTYYVSKYKKKLGKNNKRKVIGTGVNN